MPLSKQASTRVIKCQTGKSETQTGTLALAWHQTKSEDKKGLTKVAAKDQSKDPKDPGDELFRLPECASNRSELTALVKHLKESKHFGGKKNEVSLLRFYPLGGFENVMLVGLGAKEKICAEHLRQGGAAVYLGQVKEKIRHVNIDTESFFDGFEGDHLLGAVQAFAEGYLMAGYEFLDFKKKVARDFEVEGLTLLGKNLKGWEEVIQTAETLSTGVNFARSLGDRPGNILTPTEFANLCVQMAKEVRLKSTILGGKDLIKEKMGLFWGVAKGSIEDPKLIILEHSGGKKSDKPVVLIGKGITFDSGGISLKPPSRMEDMKYDMMGAAAVAGIMRAVAVLKLPLNVTGYIGASENMPGGRAQKPGDVQVSLSGKTVEIVNTDAEGRLVMADVIEYAQKHSTPAAMLDFATLTGAVVDALGSVTTGIMGNHDGLIARIKESSEKTGERVWQLPLYEEYEEDLKSSYADIRNSGVREAGASKAGTFLKFFVDSKIPWVHCDVAGSAYHRKDLNYHPSKYGAGVMVRLVTHLLANWKPF